MGAVDVLVVGAGPAGLCLARGLADTGLSVTLVELQPAAALAEPAFDGREIALTHASRQIMRTLGLWERIDPAQVSPLRSAKVMNGASDLVVEVFGDKGRHTRTTVGVAVLPTNAAVEVDGIFEVA